LPLLGLSACAPSPAPEAAQAAVTADRTEVQETLICQPDRSLLVPQSPPDCVFGRPDLKTLDPNQRTRLKIEYGLQCYQGGKDRPRAAAAAAADEPMWPRGLPLTPTMRLSPVPADVETVKWHNSVIFSPSWAGIIHSISAEYSPPILGGNLGREF
jgi:hypothetical protein